jgi:Aspartyl/Asparaginyl beta-hydroxylase
MKNRKQLPCFGYLDNFTIDMPALIEHLKTNGLLEFDNYNDINLKNQSTMRDFIVANEYCHSTFFKEEEAELMNSDKFRHLMLTKFDESKRTDKVNFKFTSVYERQRRLDPNSPNYMPEADELNYGVRTELVTGEIEKILDMFTSKITRVRLAYIAGNHDLKPHIDYDPSYIARYHIPIITNTGANMFMNRNGQIYKKHLPADGRVYFFNTGIKHWVENNSDQARVHLIIDVHGQDELEHLVSLDEEALQLAEV